MGRLLTDPFTRRLAQIVLGAAVFFLFLASFSPVIFLIVDYFGRLDGPLARGAVLFFKLLTLPFDNILASVLVPFGSLIPLVFSTVVFQVDTTAAPPVATSTLNHLGKAVVIVMGLGLVAGIVTLIIFNLLNERAEFLTGGAAAKKQLQGTISGILAFQAIYFVELMGLKPK